MISTMLALNDDVSSLSSSEPCSEDDMSEVDNDYFFLMPPYEEAPMKNRDSYPQSPDCFTASHLGADFIAENDLPVQSLAREKKESINPPAPASPTSVIIHKFGQEENAFASKKDFYSSCPPPPYILQPDLPVRNETFAHDTNDDDDCTDCTPFVGLDLDLDDLSVYADDDSDESDLPQINTYGNSAFLVPPGKTTAENKMSSSKLIDFFRRMTWCLSPKTSAGGRDRIKNLLRHQSLLLPKTGAARAA